MAVDRFQHTCIEYRHYHHWRHNRRHNQHVYYILDLHRLVRLIRLVRTLNRSQSRCWGRSRSGSSYIDSTPSALLDPTTTVEEPTSTANRDADRIFTACSTTIRGAVWSTTFSGATYGRRDAGIGLGQSEEI